MSAACFMGITGQRAGKSPRNTAIRLLAGQFEQEPIELIEAVIVHFDDAALQGLPGKLDPRAQCPLKPLLDIADR